jgi:hypothetical protein
MQCHKHKEPDPCASLHRVTADFNTYEDFGAVIDGWVAYPTDTFCTAWLRFEAKEEGATYKWIIGADTYTQRSFTLHFGGSVPRGTNIPVTLIVNKTPDNSCFPDDDGIDTLTKNIYYAHTCTEGLVNGKYQGYWEENPSDVFIIQIEPCKYNPQSFINELYLTNMDKSDTCGTFCYSYIGYKKIKFASQGDYCSYPVGVAFVNGDNNSIIIDYNTQEGNNPYTYPQHRFIGTKVP